MPATLKPLKQIIIREERASGFAPVTGARVDREKGIIYACKVVGRSSPNTHGVRGVTGTEYELDALKAAAHLYEGADVNVDHPSRKTPDQERSALSRFGWIDNIVVAESGLYGDLHFYNPDHDLAISLMNAADVREGKGFALSHNAVGRGEVRNGKYVVTEIPEVRSVDIVADGGTNRSLFEGAETMTTTTLKELLEAAPKEKYPRLRKLVKLWEDAADMSVDVPDAPDEPDELDHLYNAFKTCMKNDPEKAKKILALLEPEESETDTEESDNSNDDDSEPNADDNKKEGRKVKPTKPGEIHLTEARVKSLCKAAGIEPIQDVLDACSGATLEQALGVINIAKRNAAPARGTPPRSTSRVPVQESAAPGASDSKGWAQKLLG